MDKRKLAEIERKNNTGHISPADVADLIKRIRLLESVLADRLEYDYRQPRKQKRP